MARPAAEHPTELELQILKILWRHSPAGPGAMPVREVRQALADRGRDIAHTSVITTLNTMVAKKYLRRKKEGKAYLFTPRVSEDEVGQRMLGDVVTRAFDGSAKAVVLSLFSQSDLDPEELAELRRLIDARLKGKK